MKIPFLEIGDSYRELKSEIDTSVLRVLNSGNYILGSEVEDFEINWAQYCEAKYAVGLANGMDALILALRSLDVGPEDEVIVPSHTYIATWLAISAVGAIPVPVEPDPNTYNIDPINISSAITQKTKVLLPVHLYGQPANIDPILKIAKQHGLSVVEDAAQSHGARYKGRRIGAHGDIVCWSFYPGKNLGAFGDAGAITTDRADLAEKIQILRNYGSPKKYVNNLRGINSRLDPIHAAVLGVKLKYLSKWNDRRRAIADMYQKELKNIGLVLPFVPEWAEAVWHLYVIRSSKRDSLKDRLTDEGIGILMHYPIPPHMQKAFTSLGFTGDSFPLAQKLANEVLSLPIGPQLEIKNAEYIVSALKSVL